jgi:penicillin-binding protein 2
VTPLQLARATATLANKGAIVTPFLVDRITTAQQTRAGLETHKGMIDLSAKNINTVIDGMVNVVHSPRGTAKGINQGLSYHIAGKTGTAQVVGIKQNAKYNENDIDRKYRDHALFIAFAPADDPQIAVAVVVENGGHGGSVAAPIAAQVIEQYLQQGNYEH